jgi:hypothetical protein
MRSSVMRPASLHGYRSFDHRRQQPAVGMARPLHQFLLFRFSLEDDRTGRIDHHLEEGDVEPTSSRSVRLYNKAVPRRLNA